MLTRPMVVPILMLAMISIFPLSMGKLKFVPIYKALTIRANKKLPPHIAYLDSHFDIQDMDWAEFDKKKKQPLVADGSLPPQQGPYVLTQKRVLEGIVIRKDVASIIPAPIATTRVFKTAAQAAQETEGPQWLKNIVQPETTLAAAPKQAEQTLTNLTAAKRITGQIELREGLAVTNEHHIEIRRSDEGVFHEMGQVDLAKGSYSIDVNEASGVILARLLDKSGKILGEGSVRLSQIQPTQSRLLYGPRLEVAPNPNWNGTVSSYYPTKPSSGKDSQTRVTSFGGENEMPLGKNDEVTLDNVAKNSATVVRAHCAGHMASNKVVVVGDERFGMTMFPTAMMEALKSIVSDGAPQISLDESTIVWGTVSLDGHPISGATVTSETDPEAKAVYFNEFMIPDPKLTSTSSNGLYAFMNIQQGFNAVLAQRGEAYFGHQNVVVELGTVAIGDIQNTLRTEPVRIRAFDAFAGEPLSVVANMQSLSQPVEVQEGNASVILPQISRLSMIYTEVEPNYVPANYFYNDRDSYIHLPMIRKDWLVNLKAGEKINDIPKTGTIVGFVGEENFEVYLAGIQKDSNIQVVYFDAAGRSLNSSKGVAGGGFVIFNVPMGTQEPVIVGGGSEKVYSKVVPVDPDTTSVVSFIVY